MAIATLTEKLQREFPESQARLLAEVIEDNRRNTIKPSDFTELKQIVKELAEVQKRTEIKVEELAEAQKELSEAQKRTEIKVEELAEAQKRTEIKVEELAEAQKRTEIKVEELAEAQKKTEEAVRELAIDMKGTRGELAGLGKSVSYALENEAFRAVPSFLKERHGIALLQRLVRTDIEGKEINLLGKGTKDGREIMVVGEATLRLDTRNKFLQLEENVELVSKRHPGIQIVPVMITHYATENILQRAKEKGVIVIQSFEWE